MTRADIPAMPGLSDGGALLLPWLERMRGEQPLWANASGGYHVFRYADVQTVLAAPERFSSNLGRLMPFIPPEKLSGNMLWTDPPAHRALRRLVGQAFTSRTVTALRPRIEAIAAELVAAAPDGEFDFVDAVAFPLPVIVIAELLGVSPADRAFFRDCADRSLGIRVDEGRSPEELAAIVADATKDLDDYLLAEVRSRRARPSDDLISKLAAAEVDGERLTDLEVATFAVLLLNAGYVTTTLLLGNALLCLRDNPAVEPRLRADRSLLPAAIEEVLRHRPPLPHAYRIAEQDVPIAGGVVPANAFVTVSLLSANHDEEQFPDPEHFDVGRTPNKHVAFGHGIHFCLGAPLARLETEIAINALFDQFTDLRAGDDVTFHTTEFHGPARLTVSARR